MNISKHIDLTLLQSTTTNRDIIDLCYEAKQSDMRTICINSSYVPLATELLKDSNIKVCTVVGFPLGATTTQSKIYEAQEAIENGADEIEMMINLGHLKSTNYVAVLKDITDVKLAIGAIPLKVNIEISELTKNEIIKACEICVDAKAQFIKTSSGFSKSGATLTAINIMKKTLKGRAGIEASGGIKRLSIASKYIEAGVSRVSISFKDINFSKKRFKLTSELLEVNV
ncbi:deoxyribose-phosphate aldolase [Changchengzhania lutea]|uniref:deoxyribose-phosphate aldolase n=1 Tax=Changchengzhania lutea TaxID=2049305 RepID=UPI00115DD2D5|nr:deoxyribose-phosphate aldolase [Changchengzhania lutea]